MTFVQTGIPCHEQLATLGRCYHSVRYPFLWNFLVCLCVYSTRWDDDILLSSHFPNQRDGKFDKEKQQGVNHTSDDIIDRNHVARMFRSPHVNNFSFFFLHKHTTQHTHTHNTPYTFLLVKWLCRKWLEKKKNYKAALRWEASFVSLSVLFQTVARSG